MATVKEAKEKLLQNIIEGGSSNDMVNNAAACRELCSGESIDASVRRDAGERPQSDRAEAAAAGD